MDYSRFNYVAQPEDNIPRRILFRKSDLTTSGPRCGATNRFRRKDAGRRKEDAQRMGQGTGCKILVCVFPPINARGSDPGENTEAVGDADAIVATGLGIKNLKRVADMLLPATSQPGEPYDDLEELYARMLGQWSLELNHVTGIVGGFNSQQKHNGQDGVRFVIVPKERQAAAVRFLNENAFATPTWAVKPEILRRIEPSGALARVNLAQERVLNSLLNNARFDRLVEQEAIDGAAAYRPSDFMSDLAPRDLE